MSPWGERFSFICTSLESVLVIHGRVRSVKGNKPEFSIMVSGVCVLCAPGSSMESHQDTGLDLINK